MRKSNVPIHFLYSFDIWGLVILANTLGIIPALLEKASICHEVLLNADKLLWDYSSFFPTVSM